MNLAALTSLLQRTPGFADVQAALDQRQTTLIDGAWGSATALSCAALIAPVDGTATDQSAITGGPILLVVLPRTSEVDDFADDLSGFLGALSLKLPAWEAIPDEERADDPVFAGRMRILRELDRSPANPAGSNVSVSAPPAAAGSGIRGMLRKRKGEPEKNEADEAKLPPPVRPRRVVVTSIAALLQPVPSREELAQSTRTLRRGDEFGPDALVDWLLERGFSRVAAVEMPGEYSVHGGIVDIFPYAETDPVRIEFFGDEIESLRRFDVQTQRKIEELTELSMLAAGRKKTDEADDSTTTEDDDEALLILASYAQKKAAAPPAAVTGSAHLTDWMPSGSWVALVDLTELTNEGKQYLQRLSNPRGYYTVEATLSRLAQSPCVTVSGISEQGYATSCHLPIESIERFQRPTAQIVSEIDEIAGTEDRVMVVCHNAGELQRVREVFSTSKLAESNRLLLTEGRMVRGFRLGSDKLVVVSDHELFHRREVRRTTKKQSATTPGRAIDSFLDLKEGDLVVHLSHGIARYRGMQFIEKLDKQEEHLVLEFKDAVRVFVPVSLIHLVQKYVGGARSAPNLSSLGGNSWEKKKQAAANAVADLAGDMLTLQAARESKPGITFPIDSHWQIEFEEAFPYDPTPDQVTAISSIKDDMQRPRPMDRLICGDVGYGKTEVAMRAAFKAIDNGKQVAVLVPTTVLAEQHYRTFCDRMAEFPFRIEVLSRFRTRKEQRTVLDELELGTVDLVIGTHRILSEDVKFADLGLLVIDEEQRFGVDAKEKLKKLRLEVDVLTLSATPIPRTLHLSLLGIRDISNLQTPPVDRVAVETRVCRYDAELIRRAIVREMNRGGQVYFVHNRVYNIETIADQLQAIVPEARIGIIHGQMDESQLETTLVAFVDQRLDILVATTIIESGLDIPNANTIFINQANIYGLADLHQLRGRVGRYKHRAYCYLLLDAGQSLTGTAARRLKAIEEFSDLGAGFKIAMRDLEIRGAGNILGTEQSGHIAAVGYELYCQLLETTVRKLKKEPLKEVAHVAINLPIDAYLPSGFIPDGKPKIEAYRRLSRMTSIEELDEWVTELKDRFGSLPEPAETLIELKRIQLLAQPWQIDDLHLEPGFLVLKYRNPLRIKQLVRATGNRLRVVDDRSAFLPLSEEVASGRKLLVVVKTLLQQNAVPL